MEERDSESEKPVEALNFSDDSSKYDNNENNNIKNDKNSDTNNNKNDDPPQVQMFDNNNFNNDVKNIVKPTGNQNNNNNLYQVGLQVENFDINPQPNHQQVLQPFQQSYYNQPMMNQNQQFNQMPQYYGQQGGQFQPQMNQGGGGFYGASNPNGFYGQSNQGGFYGANDGGMILPGIPVQMQDPPAQQRNGVPINQNAVIIQVNGEQQVRQALVLRIRKNTKWFTGCNACFTILIVINLLNKISLYKYESSKNSDDERDRYSRDDDDGRGPNDLFRASAIISIMEYIIWIVLIILAIHGLTNNKLHMIGYYIKGLCFCIFMETLASILIFAGFSDASPVEKVSFVIVYLLTIIILYSFIKNAKILLADIQAYKDKFGGNPITDQLNPNNNQQQLNQNMQQANNAPIINQPFNNNYNNYGNQAPRV